MRGAFAYYVVDDSFLKVTHWTGQPHPTGLAHWLDLSFCSDPGFSDVLVFWFRIALMLYTLGLALPVTLGWATAVQICFCTLDNSQGFTGHSAQLVSLGLLAQWVAACVSCRTGWRESLWGSVPAMNRALDWTRQTVAASYVVAAVSKLVASSGLWMWKAPLVVVQIRKATQLDAASTGDDTPGSLAGLTQLITDHPGLARLIIGPALPLEFCAFLLCWHRGFGAVYGLALLAFHASVSEMMQIDFHATMWMVAIFFVHPVGWLTRWARVWWGRGIAR
jgi:hypothetical protein